MSNQTYTVSVENQTILADATLVIVHAAATLVTRASRLEVLRASCSQRGTAVSQQLGIMLAGKVTAFGTYVAATPSPHNIATVPSGIAGATTGAAATAGVKATAEGAGGVTPIWQEDFNNIAGWLWVPVPEERIQVEPDGAVILKIIGTPTTLTGWTFGLTYRELT